MANMSYCRMENTLKDLCDCTNAILFEGIDSLSERELEKARLLSKECQSFIRAMDRYPEEDEEYESETGKDDCEGCVHNGENTCIGGDSSVCKQWENTHDN